MEVSLTDLVAKWRGKDAEVTWYAGEADILRGCADELEAALAHQVQPPLATTAWAEAWDKANNGKPGYIPYEPAPPQPTAATCRHGKTMGQFHYVPTSETRGLVMHECTGPYSQQRGMK